MFLFRHNLCIVFSKYYAALHFFKNNLKNMSAFSKTSFFLITSICIIFNFTKYNYLFHEIWNAFTLLMYEVILMGYNVKRDKVKPIKIEQKIIFFIKVIYIYLIS